MKNKLFKLKYGKYDGEYIKIDDYWYYKNHVNFINHWCFFNQNIIYKSRLINYLKFGIRLSIMNEK